MAIRILGHDISAQGEWTVDYDDVGLTIGHTVIPGTKSHLIITITEIDTNQASPTYEQPLPGGLTVTKDVSNDMNKGRVIDANNVPNSKVPLHVKGQVYPYDFDSRWY